MDEKRKREKSLDQRPAGKRMNKNSSEVRRERSQP